MFLAQLAAFLTAHHHHAWAVMLPIDPPAVFARVQHWAVMHGFIYQP